MLAVTRGESMHVLFHCFGGINRSVGVLCAWLVVDYNYSADAVQLLLEKRPALRPWDNRPCLGGLVAAGRFAGQVAHGTECGGQKLICTTVRLERLFVANVLNQ